MFGHLEADECGAMNLFLAAAPNAQVAHTALGCMVSINDLADRPPAPIAPGGSSTSAAGASAASTPPTCPTAGTRTCSTRRPPARCSAATSSRMSATARRSPTNDLLDAAAQAEDMFGATCLTPKTAPTIRRLADLDPTTLAIMHGSSYNGDATQRPPRAGRRLRPPVDGNQPTAPALGVSTLASTSASLPNSTRTLRSANTERPIRADRGHDPHLLQQADPRGIPPPPRHVTP